MKIEKDLYRKIGALLLFAMMVPALVYASNGYSSNYGGTNTSAPIPPSPTFNITTNTITVCRGLTNFIPLNITDYGNAYGAGMSDVQLSFSNKNIIQPSTITVNSINPHTSDVIDAPIFFDYNTSPGLTVLEIPITFDYLNIYTSSQVKNVTLDVLNCPSDFPLQVNLSTDVLVSGQVNNLTLSFKNTGDSTLNSISAQTSISSSQSGITFINHKPIEISSLAPYATVNVTEEMYENASQIFPFNVSITLYNGTEFAQAMDSFSMLSSGTVVMVPSSISITPTSVTPGSIFLISLVITDTGTSGVSNANATAILPSGFSDYGTTSSDYIGSIGTETPTPISLTLMANSSVKSGSYTIPIKLDYLGSFREALSSIVNVTVNITSSGSSGLSGSTTGGTPLSTSASSSGDTGLYIAIAAFVAAIAVIFVGVPMLNKRKRAEEPKPR